MRIKDNHILLTAFRGTSAELIVPTKLSHNAGTSFCNRLYRNGLRYLAERQGDRSTKMVFVHVPFVKNISDFEDFKKRIMRAITIFIQGLIN